MRRSAASALAVLAGLLGACGGAPSGEGSVSGPALGHVISATPAVGDGNDITAVELAALKDRQKAGAPATPPGELVLITPPAEAVSPKLQSLIAKSDVELANSLGAPDFRRTDGDAQIWQYRSPACILDAFLYRGRDGVHIKHVETRGLNVRRLDPDACFMDLLSAHAAGARPVVQETASETASPSSTGSSPQAQPNAGAAR
jgi:hypothetical protein